MEKDFSFYPSHPTALNRLTAEQVETYNRDGYIKNASHSLRRIKQSRIGPILTAFSGMPFPKENSYSISGSHVVYGGVFDLVTSPPL